MSRNVSVSRCRAMAEAVSCWPVTAECRVASRASQCETPIYATANCMLFVPCVFLQSYYHPTPVACDAPFMTYINSYMFRYQVVINCVPRSAFMG